MANLTVTVAVTTGTQYVTGSTGSIYTFNGSQPASFTFPWVASGTIRLDQSGSSNDGHPLIFSTSNSSVLATMKAGIISSGVTYYLDGSSNQTDYTNTTTFNAATTRYIEIAPTSETDFYFACWVHGIGMGGIMDITQNTWGALSWSDHDWGDQDTITVFPSGLSITSSLGTVEAFPEQGWGSDTWGTENWGESGLTVTPTGFSMTASLGDLAYSAATDGWGRHSWGEDDWGDDTLTFIPTGLSMTGSVGEASGFSEQGWGRAAWGEEPWGDSNSPTVILTDSLLATASLGTLPYAQSEEGWGRDEWGTGNWGENTTTVILDGLEITALQGPSGWGQAPWNEMIGWGGDLRCETTQLTIAALTGIEATLSLGTPTISRLDMIFDITGPAAMGAGLGVLNINDGADHSQGVGSLLNTMSLGTPLVEISALPAGILATMSLGTVTATNTELVNLTGIEANFYALNVPTVDDMAIGLSGLSMTGSVGSLTVTDMQVGISGLEMTGDLGSGGVSPLHYKDVDITGNTSYTYVEHTA
jgi:hypothetical protein